MAQMHAVHTPPFQHSLVTILNAAGSSIWPETTLRLLPQTCYASARLPHGDGPAAASCYDCLDINVALAHFLWQPRPSRPERQTQSRGRGLKTIGARAAIAGIAVGYYALCLKWSQTYCAHVMSTTLPAVPIFSTGYAGLGVRNNGKSLSPWARLDGQRKACSQVVVLHKQFLCLRQPDLRQKQLLAFLEVQCTA